MELETDLSVFLDQVDNDFLGFAALDFDGVNDGLPVQAMPLNRSAVLQTLIAQQKRLNAGRAWTIAASRSLSSSAQLKLNAQMATWGTSAAPTREVVEAQLGVKKRPRAPAHDGESGESGVGAKRTPWGCRMITNSRSGIEFVCDSFLNHRALSTTSVVFTTNKLKGGMKSLRSSVRIKADLQGEQLDPAVIIRGPIYHVPESMDLTAAKAAVMNHAAPVLFNVYVKVVTHIRPICTETGVLPEIYAEREFDFARPSQRCRVLPVMGKTPSVGKLGAEFSIMDPVIKALEVLCPVLGLEVPLPKRRAISPVSSPLGNDAPSGGQESDSEDNDSSDSDSDSDSEDNDSSDSDSEDNDSSDSDSEDNDSSDSGSGDSNNDSDSGEDSGTEATFNDRDV